MDNNIPPKEIAEEEMIDQAFQQLLHDYLATKHRKRVEIITKAFNFANQAHKGIKRRSGEPYIMHPLNVAIILAELELDKETIVAGILHDVGKSKIPNEILNKNTRLTDEEFAIMNKSPFAAM